VSTTLEAEEWGYPRNKIATVSENKLLRKSIRQHKSPHDTDCIDIVDDIWWRWGVP
jgi:hypothetical protein